MKHVSLVAVALIALGAAATAQATSYTTNLYWKNNVAEDIAKSCKDVSVASTTGVVSATCNHYRSSTSDEVDQYDSTLDLDDEIYCKCDHAISQLSSHLSWGDGAGACTGTIYNPKSWSMALDSTGKKYIVTATCSTTQSGGVDRTTSLNLGHTTKGLKNSSGSLAGR